MPAPARRSLPNSGSPRVIGELEQYGIPYTIHTGENTFLERDPRLKHAGRGAALPRRVRWPAVRSA